MSRPLLVLIPGGPGFSGGGFRSFVTPLLRSFDVVTEIENELKTLKRPSAIAGHSFGAVVAADLATRKGYEMNGYVGIAAPVSVDAMKTAATVPSPHHTPAMQKAQDSFMAHFDDANWNQMIESVAALYFGPPHLKQGTKLLLSDKPEYRLYLQILFPYVNAKVGQDVSSRLSEFKKPKILIAGGADRLVPVLAIENDAKTLGCEFEIVSEASHFVFIEQPKKTTAFRKAFPQIAAVNSPPRTA